MTGFVRVAVLVLVLGTALVVADDRFTESPYTRPTNIPDAAPPSCEDPNLEYLLIPDPADCRKFIVCLNGASWSFDCPAPLFFSYTLQRCEWPKTSGCTQPTTPAAPTAAPPAP